MTDMHQLLEKLFAAELAEKEARAQVMEAIHDLPAPLCYATPSEIRTLLHRQKRIEIQAGFRED